VWEAKISFTYNEVDVSGNSQVGCSAEMRDEGRAVDLGVIRVEKE
jgi:hypothetical protein